MTENKGAAVYTYVIHPAAPWRKQIDQAAKGMGQALGQSILIPGFQSLIFCLLQLYIPQAPNPSKNRAKSNQ